MRQRSRLGVKKPSVVTDRVTRSEKSADGSKRDERRQSDIARMRARSRERRSTAAFIFGQLTAFLDGGISSLHNSSGNDATRRDERKKWPRTENNGAGWAKGAEKSRRGEDATTRDTRGFPRLPPRYVLRLRNLSIWNFSQGILAFFLSYLLAISPSKLRRIERVAFTINRAFLARAQHEIRLLNFPSKALFSSRPCDVLLSYRRNTPNGRQRNTVVLTMSTTRFELESVGAVTKTNEGNANYCLSPIRTCITPW